MDALVLYLTLRMTLSLLEASRVAQVKKSLGHTLAYDGVGKPNLRDNHIRGENIHDIGSLLFE